MAGGDIDIVPLYFLLQSLDVTAVGLSWAGEPVMAVRATVAADVGSDKSGADSRRTC